MSARRADPDVSVIVVNFNSGAMLERFLASLRLEDEDDLSVDITVVDCASPMDQSRWLNAVEREGVRVVRLIENLGYAGGLTVGVEQSRGETLILCNADLLAVGPLVRPLHQFVLSHRDVACVAPRAYIDPDCQFLVPDFRMLNTMELLREWGCELSPRCAARVARNRSATRRAFWRSEKSTEHESLHGACIAMRRATLAGLGGFDPGFPLYYEDTDLFHRARAAGLRLMSVPEPRIVHLIHRSSSTVWPAAMDKLEVGRSHFLVKHGVVGTAWLDRKIRALARRHAMRRADRDRQQAHFSSAPRLCLDHGGEVLIELAFDAHFLEAAGHFTRGPEFVFPETTWQSLLPGRYHLRALDARSGEELGRWICNRPVITT